MAHGPLLALDERLGRALSRPHSPSPVAEFCAGLGNTEVGLPVLVAAVCWSAWRGFRSCGARAEAGPDGGRDGARAPSPRRVRPWWWLPSVAAALAMAAVPALVVPLKLWIARPGPLGPAEDYGWYPSGHTATAAVAFGAAALLLLPHVRRTVTRRLAVAAVLLLNLAVGAGLVRRGYHWPLDVIGSWCLCALLLWGVARVVSGSVTGTAAER
ncbi:phosphatase PAP2 family protein [Streptomyces sp. 8N706]|uniref:phosphatase PAP2 family protein n=1 Tax=Streptomyces sp. 8N706 TaxID=3457416 RepID=UPI003FD36B11